MSKPANDHRAESIRHRLRNLLRERGEDVQFGLQRYAIERFLYRLGVSAHRERFVLKGAALFALWGGSVYRPTRDLDFTGYGSADEADVLAALREICVLSSPSDELVFDPDTLSAEPIRDNSEYNGLRIRLAATLGTSRIPIQIDIGFGNAIEPSPQYADYPTLLDDPPPRIRIYPSEAVVAEKLHAMVVLGERNSRYKDFYDLHVLARQFQFDGECLARAIAATFERRRTQINAALPTALTPRFFSDEARAAQWRAYLTRNNLPGAPANLGDIGETLIGFLGPVWSGLAENAAFTSTWPPGGAWKFEDAENEIRTPAHTPASPTSHGQQRSDNADPPRIEDIEIPIAVPLRRFKPYPAYKDSGIDWLGVIPEHWEASRLKNIATVVLSNIDKKSVEGQEAVRLCNYVDVYYNERITSGIEFMAATATPEQIERFQLRRGDVLVTKDSETPDDIAVPSVVVEDLPGVICGYHLAHIRPNEAHVNGAFLARAFSAIGPRDQFHIAANGITRYGLSGDSICSGLFVVPSLDEQRAIAAFLDRETAKIDVAVAKKERLIELLEEKRAALITRAVTKGLDPNVFMKDSGVAWLGEIPAHWEVKRLWHLTPSDRRIMYGIVLPGPNVDEGIPIVKGGDVSPEGLRLDRLNRTTAEIESGYVRSRLKGGDLVYAIRGSIGEVAIVPDALEGANLTQDAARVAYTSGTHGPWLLYALKAAAVFAQLEAGALGATIRGVNIRDLKRASIPVPPGVEQEAIAIFLNGETTKIDKLLAKIRDGIERLQELRATLISAAVTGKIDVRNVGTHRNVPLQNDGAFLPTGAVDE